MNRYNTLRPFAVLGLGAFLALGFGTTTRAQHTPDPYQPWNSQYEQYVYPQFPYGNLGITPNQAIIQSGGNRSTARAYERYLEESELIDAATGDAGPARRNPGVPYYRAYRQLDRTFKRTYTPNEEVDRSYAAARKARDEKYNQYLSAGDAQQRAKLRKEYENLNRKVQHDLSAGSRGPERPASTTPRSARPELPSVTAPTGPPAAARPNASSRTPSDVLRRSESLGRPSAPAPSSPATPAPASPPRQ